MWWTLIVLLCAEAESNVVSVLERAPRPQIRVAKLFGWQPLDAQQLLLWTGKEEVWRMYVAAGCDTLLKVRSIVVTTSEGHIVAGKDKIYLGTKSCLIVKMTEPDSILKRRYGKARHGFVAALATSTTFQINKHMWSVG